MFDNFCSILYFKWKVQSCNNGWFNILRSFLPPCNEQNCRPDLMPVITRQKYKETWWSNYRRKIQVCEHVLEIIDICVIKLWVKESETNTLKTVDQGKDNAVKTELVILISYIELNEICLYNDCIDSRAVPKIFSYKSLYCSVFWVHF